MGMTVKELQAAVAAALAYLELKSGTARTTKPEKTRDRLVAQYEHVSGQAEWAAITGITWTWRAFQGTVPAPDVPAPQSDEPDTSGWWYSAQSRFEHVGRGWSSTVSHGTDGPSRRGSGSQEPRALYSTQKRALVALRAHRIKEFAAEIRALDEAIRYAGEE